MDLFGSSIELDFFDNWTNRNFIVWSRSINEHNQTQSMDLFRLYSIEFEYWAFDWLRRVQWIEAAKWLCSMEC